MLRINQLKLPVGHSEKELVQQVKKLLRCKEMPRITIVRRSIDARKKPRLYFNYILNVQVHNELEVYCKCDKSRVLLWDEKPYLFPAGLYKGKKRPVIIGTGPAGLFCGYMLAEAGFCPILLERGKPVEERTKDVEKFWETGDLDPESNVQFGEGGAGTFSDGKLNTLVKDKYGRNRKVLSLFVEAGAPEEILYDHKPHMGTDILCRVVSNLRKAILDKGGEVWFEAKATDFVIEQGKIAGVIINGTQMLKAEYVVLAPGHSARDTFSMLYERQIPMEAKAFAVGLRVEHFQSMINKSQYGTNDPGSLGAAPYKVAAKGRNGRGVYSFCMCPGGYVVNASSEPGRTAVNGMSYSGRNGINANSAVIVSVTPEDFGSSHPLAGVEFQRQLEEKAWELGQGKIPAQRYGEFRERVLQKARKAQSGEDSLTLDEGTEIVRAGDDSVIEPQCKGAYVWTDLSGLLPEECSEAFVDGMENFGRQIKGFDRPDTVLLGVESRTSSPVRIERDEKLQSKIRGLYPCGEGAGYAGGITSAAMDGLRVAEQIASEFAPWQAGD